MKTTQIGYGNCYRVDFNTGWSFFKSYRTIVGMEAPNGDRVRSAHSWSKTTSKQLTKHWTPNEKAFKVPQRDIDAAYNAQINAEARTIRGHLFDALALETN